MVSESGLTQVADLVVGLDILLNGLTAGTIAFFKLYRLSVSRFAKLGALGGCVVMHDGRRG